MFTRPIGASALTGMPGLLAGACSSDRMYCDTGSAWLPVSADRKQATSNCHDDFDVHCIAKRLVCARLRGGEVLEVTHALKPRTLAHCHVAALPRDDWNL